MLIFLCRLGSQDGFKTSRTSCEHIWLLLQARSALSVNFTYKMVGLWLCLLNAICKKTNKSSLDRYIEGERENFCSWLHYSVCLHGLSSNLGKL